MGLTISEATEGSCSLDMSQHRRECSCGQEQFWARSMKSRCVAVPQGRRLLPLLVSGGSWHSLAGGYIPLVVHSVVT